LNVKLIKIPTKQTAANLNPIATEILFVELAEQKD